MDNYKVNEIFGPTMQGEGPMTGRLMVFVRLLFCDGDGQGHWCSRCDTRYSWDKDDPGYTFEEMTAEQILQEVNRRYGANTWKEDRAGTPVTRTVSFSGGNPVLQMDEGLVALFRQNKYRVQVETQGTVWKPFLSYCEVALSPKPPSSGLSQLTDVQWGEWINNQPKDRLCVKIVVADKADYEWAKNIYTMLQPSKTGHSKSIAFYLQPVIDREVKTDIKVALLYAYKELVEKWLKRGDMPDAIVLPQMHVLVWGASR